MIRESLLNKEVLTMKNNSHLSLHINLDSFIPATDEEKEYLVKNRPSSTFFRDGMQRLLKNKIATLSLLIILIITYMNFCIHMKKS